MTSPTPANYQGNLKDFLITSSLASERFLTNSLQAIIKIRLLKHFLAVLVLALIISLFQDTGKYSRQTADSIESAFVSIFWILPQSGSTNAFLRLRNLPAGFTIGGGHDDAICTIAFANQVNATLFDQNIKWEFDCPSPSVHEKSFFITQQPGTYFMRWVSLT
jgi:hypothetical protein